MDGDHPNLGFDFNLLGFNYFFLATDTQRCHRPPYFLQTYAIYTYIKYATWSAHDATIWLLMIFNGPKESVVKRYEPKL